MSESTSVPELAAGSLPAAEVRTQRTNTKLLRAFAVQLMLVSLVTVLAVFITNWIVQGILTREALVSEAEHFWSRYRIDPDSSLPQTANLRGYMRPADPDGAETGFIPTPLLSLTPGYGRVSALEGEPLVHVSDFDGQRLYLVFAVGQVSELAFYYGLLPLAIVLLLIYVLAMLTYRASIDAISPMVRLANYLEAFDYRQSSEIDLEPLREPGNTEVNTLIDAVSHFADRFESTLERERVFARDASHELRTPVAVFKGSIDLLEQNAERPKYELDALTRMRRTADNMQSLLETLLLLARDEYPTIPEEPASLNAVVHSERERISSVAELKNVRVSIEASGEVPVAAPAEVLEILVNNLLRNAVNYSPGGTVDLVVTPGQLTVRDSGVGMAPEELGQLFQTFYRGANGRATASGHGLGLAIVKRICDRYGWTVEVDSELGVGTEFRVRF
ncbi:MAG: HAMP domain-containing sensor histidine kinase [Pseudomonadota bacterium]